MARIAASDALDMSPLVTRAESHDDRSAATPALEVSIVASPDCKSTVASIAALTALSVAVGGEDPDNVPRERRTIFAQSPVAELSRISNAACVEMFCPVNVVVCVFRLTTPAAREAGTGESALNAAAT